MKPEKTQSSIFDKLQVLNYLPFDSEVFGFPFFRVTQLENSLAHDLELLCNYKIGTFGCDAKVSSKDYSSIVHLKNYGFVHVCDQITYDIFPYSSKFTTNLEVVELSNINQEEIALHANNFKDDRLSRDPRIPHETVKEFYSKWISNSFKFKNKSIYSLDSALCITQLKKNVLKIDLLSVLDKRKGLGTQMIEHILAHTSEAEFSSVEVTTEADNAGAIKVYTQNGFQEKTLSSCLHFFHFDDLNKA